MSIVITVAPTGPIATKADNPALPTSPEEIATAVEQAYHAGAAVAHIHLRDENERPTADPNIARRAMDLIGERCPILIQLSTGVGLTVPFEQREQLVELRPRMATLNPCSMSFGAGEFRNPPQAVRRLAARMRELDIKPELETMTPGIWRRACDCGRKTCWPNPCSSASCSGFGAEWPPPPIICSRWCAGCPPGRSGKSSRSVRPTWN
ncbi:hypothetical protein AO41_02948 [Mycobacterium tuberculosis M1787]|nr:hypothetical protein AO41_02948 [Mycobacterium tuberculosis M1787]